MARLKFVQIEIEGSEEAVVDAIRGHFRPPEPASINDLVIPPATGAVTAVLAAEEDDPIQLALPEPRRQGKRAAGKRAKAEAVEAGSLGDLILAALRKRPASAIELSGSLKLEPKQVYQATNRLKVKGLIEGREDEIDGTRRWHLK